VGTWSGWNKCPHGQYVVGVRARSKPFQQRVDNEAITDLGFYCASIKEAQVVTPAQAAAGGAAPAVAATDEKVPVVGRRDTLLRFVNGDDELSDEEKAMQKGESSTKLTVEGYPFATKKNKPKVTAGGWAASMFCQDGTYVCGLQTRIYESEKDKMGVTDYRAYCCKVTL